MKYHRVQELNRSFYLLFAYTRRKNILFSRYFDRRLMKQTHEKIAAIYEHWTVDYFAPIDIGYLFQGFYTFWFDK